MMETLIVLVDAVLGGIAIALGGTAYLSVDNAVIGSLLFAAGLFTICTFSLHLFTGHVLYVLDNDRSYALRLPLIWLGNLFGTWLTAQTLHLTRLAPALQARAEAICQMKLNDSLLSIFVLAIFCNILIFVAVDGYRHCRYELGKYLAIFFGISVFILCGFEHCIATMYYLSMARTWSGEALLCLLVMTAGNACGGVLFPAIRRWKNKTLSGG